MNAKHTPGTWKVDTSDWPIYIANAEGNRVVAEVLTQEGDGTTLANARLIAEAPNMHEELRKALDWLASYPGDGAQARYDAIRALLARIDGGDQ